LVDARVTASALLTERGVDSGSAIQLKNADGYATMSGGFVLGAKGGGSSGFQLIGDEGWLAVTDNLFNPGRALISAGGREMEEVAEPLSTERYRWEIEEAGRCLRAGQGESALVSHDLTLRVMHLLDQAMIQTKGEVLP
jgi:hypothetical protein